METKEIPSFLPSDAAVYNQAACPSRLILDRIADKWTTLVIGILAQAKHRRFNELRRMIGGISQKMLTQTLRDLERDGLARRTIYRRDSAARRVRTDAAGAHPVRAARLADAMGARPLRRGEESASGV